MEEVKLNTKVIRALFECIVILLLLISMVMVKEYMKGTCKYEQSYISRQID